MKNRFSLRILCAVLAIGLCAGCALGEGLFPSFDSMFGSAALPSMAAVLGRQPDSEETLADGGIRQAYLGIGREEFERFSAYLAEAGCILSQSSLSGGVFTAAVEKNGVSFGFSYDGATGTAVLTYPAGAVPETASAESPAKASAEYRIGDLITFGRYEQDVNLANGSEPIEWRILEVRDGMALVISRYGLDGMKFHQTVDSVSWKSSSLRTWLNGAFIDKAFTAQEQAAIQITEVDSSAVQDRLFLLSQSEAWNYFLTNEERRCAPTAYAISKGVFVSGRKYLADGEDACGWWLRTIGDRHTEAACVRYAGSRTSHAVTAAYVAVRPAMWIDLKAAGF